MRPSFSIAALALFAAAAAFGASPVSEQWTRELPIDANGMIWLNTPYGSVDVVGVDDDKATVLVNRVINAMDDQSLKDAKEAIITTFEGDSRSRVVKTRFPEARDPRWQAIVNYFVRVPRSCNVKIGGRTMDHIRVGQIAGTVTVSSYSGTIILTNVSGATTVDTVNGRVIFDYPQRPTANARVQAINADIDIYAPRDAGFEWVADTLKGDLLTTFDLRGVYNGTVYRGRVNNGAKPTLTTSTVAGRVLLLARGTSPQQARRITAQNLNEPPSGQQGSGMLQQYQRIQIPIIYAPLWAFEANVADVTVGEIRGSARVETGAGEVELGTVYGTTLIASDGGPIKLNDMMGPIDVRTGAGDIAIQLARRGGTAGTDGGIIKVGYVGGPMTLRSGGGDITVQQTAAPIDAYTRSGDVSITVRPTEKTERIIARTSQGNVTLVVSPSFAADIDAIILTHNPDANRITSDFNLSMTRELYNGKIRFHATGKINGGGERVELITEDGSINITSQVITPLLIASPRR